jgi:hypothetical protein
MTPSPSPVSTLAAYTLQFFLSRDHALRGARFHGEALTSTFTGKRPRIDAPAFTEKR